MYIYIKYKSFKCDIEFSKLRNTEHETKLKLDKRKES